MIAIVIRALLLSLTFSLVCAAFLFAVLQCSECAALCVSMVWGGVLFGYIVQIERRKHGA
mgnify:CR=1 FL=1